ncbi:MAG TPA: hypothetical protein VFT74_19590 [Isosphaeraceae bacterium]|nr:hypothetical protein [Isosphaeraceae bacterium]
MNSHAYELLVLPTASILTVCAVGLAVFLTLGFLIEWLTYDVEPGGDPSAWAEVASRRTRAESGVSAFRGLKRQPIGLSHRNPGGSVFPDLQNDG